MGILSELSQRRFLQITGGFVAAGWIAMEAADQLVGHGMLPEIWYRILWLWYIAGILGSVILGWYHGSKGRQAFTAPELSMLAVIVVVFGGLSIRTYRAAGAAPAPAAVAGDLDLSTIAIPYFQFIGEDTARAVIADGMTEALIQELSTVRGLTVISANGVRPFRDSGVPADSIARALEAGTVVEGTIEDRGDQIRVSLALVDGSSGAEFRRLGLEQPFDEILAMQDALAWDLSLYLREWLGREARRMRWSSRRT